MSKKGFLAATFLQVLVLLITAWGGLRLAAAVKGAAWLKTLPLEVPWWYFPLGGAAWMLAGMVVWLMFLTDHPWAPAAFLTLVVTFTAFWWLDRYILSSAAYFKQNWPLTLGIMGAAVVVTGVLTLPPVWNSLFGADDERTPQP